VLVQLAVADVDDPAVPVDAAQGDDVTPTRVELPVEGHGGDVQGRSRAELRPCLAPREPGHVRLVGLAVADRVHDVNPSCAQVPPARASV
jgi:hypothetical protein